MSIFGVGRSPRISLFGQGQRFAVPALARECGTRAFVCTDNRLESTPMLLEVIEGLKRAGLAVSIYADTLPELPLSCISAAIEEARKAPPDVIIGLGGGSCMDLAKLVAVGLSHNTPISALYGEFKVPGPTVPVIAIPTTAGTGSEATPVAVLGDPDKVLKVGISSPHLVPYAAICDPELTLSCPPMLTAVSGADALTHAIEAFTALRREPSATLSLDHVFIGKNAFSDHLAEAAISAIGRNLERAVKNGNDIEAREQVMLGAFYAGQSFGVAGTAAAHALQYPVGALTHTAHGLGVAVLLPFVMRFNLPSCQRDMGRIGHLMGIEGDDDDTLAAAAIERIEKLFAAIGIPRSLRELGVSEDQLPWIADQAFAITRLVKNNPRPLDPSSMQRIVTAAFHDDMSIL